MTRTDAVTTIDDSTLLAVAAAIKIAGAKASDFRALSLQKRRDYAYANQVGQTLDYWAGLKPSDAADYDEFKRRIVVAKVIGPCLNRFVTHSLGRDPEWALQEGDKPIKPTDERTMALAGWHRDASLHARLKQAMFDMLWGQTSYLRMFIPDSYSAILGGITQGGRDLAQATRLLHLQAVDATQAGRVADSSGVSVAYWYAYSVTVEGGKSENRVEIHTRQLIGQYKVDGDKLTLVAAAEGAINPQENPLYDPEEPLAFRTLMFELRRDQGSMIDESSVDLQNSFNVTKSNIRKNNDLAGHRQYATIDAAPPGVPGADGEDVEGQYAFGPNRVLDIRSEQLVDTGGSALLDLNGKPMIQKATVQTFDPVDSSSMRDDAKAFKHELLDQYNQLWTANEGQVSGESKRESRAAFDKQLPAEAAPVGAALVWAIETALQFASWLVSDSELASARLLRCTPRLYLDTLPTDLETLKVLIGMEAAGRLDQETLLENTPGVSDVTTVLERIRIGRATHDLSILAALELGGISKADAMRALQAAGYPITPDAIAQAEAMGSLDTGQDDPPEPEL